MDTNIKLGRGFYSEVFMKYSKPFVCNVVLFLLIISPLFQAKALAETPEKSADSEEKSIEIERIFVTGHRLQQGEVARSTIVLYGEDLQQQLSGNIGSTISSQPGVHSTSFGPTVGRPVIHGLDGVRVRTMEDHMDTMDTSTSSGDHAVSINPFIADEIRITKGPSTLLHGAGAIGGVVNVYTGRIPKKVPKDLLLGKMSLLGGDNGKSISGVLRFDGGLDKVAWHVDAFHQSSGDVEIPGLAESENFRSNEGVEEEGSRGVLPFSDYKTQGGAFGLSFIGHKGFIGVAASRMEMNYGLPGFSHHHDHEVPDDNDRPFIDLEQNRFYLKTGLSDIPMFEALNFQFAVSDYRHKEFESSGELGTQFENEAWEGRVEATRSLGQWDSLIGTQVSQRDYIAIGTEALMPEIITHSLGLFWLGQRDFDFFQLETGLRFDNVKQSPSLGEEREFSNYSASVGGVIPFNDKLQLSLITDYATRAPVGAELFSNGPHFATRAFEIGDPDLENETVFNFSVSLDYQEKNWSATATAYLSEFSNFIYQQRMEEKREELLVYQFTQGRASFMGMEVKVVSSIYSWQEGLLELTTFFDTVSAQVDVSGNKNLPRIPPSRVGVGLRAKSGVFTTILNYIYAFEQDKVAAYELPTDAYHDLSAYMSWKLKGKLNKTKLFVRVRNLLDSEQRYHSSFIKDIAPQPGRTIQGGVEITF